MALAGDPGTKVAVSLVWGPNANERQTIAVNGIGAAYAEFPLKFLAQADSDTARLEIAGTGEGAFHIGAVSLMPADNTQGFRAEVIAALKQLRSGVYRFPGGNFVSAHEWRDAIGDPDKRPPIMDPVWNAVQPNDVGTDEFMTLCRLARRGAVYHRQRRFRRRLVGGAVWSSTPTARPPRRWAGCAPPTAIPQPYGVKFWGIGNEAWGDWQFGAMSLKQFEIKHNLFAKAMRQVDPSIKLLASGAMPDHMTGSKHR